MDRQTEGINDELLEHLCVLSQLELTGEERMQVKEDLGRMLQLIRKLEEADTTQIQPMSHILPERNVFREDCEEESVSTEKILENGPEVCDGMYVVHKVL